jgi:hypothetical protein
MKKRFLIVRREIIEKKWYCAIIISEFSENFFGLLRSITYG